MDSISLSNNLNNWMILQQQQPVQSFQSNGDEQMVFQQQLTTPTSPTIQSLSSLKLYFSPMHKMSLYSLEKRIDYHLSRIMKGHRLINFKNSIERLPTEKRICECIMEVLMSSWNLIARKARIIADAKTLVDTLNEFPRSYTDSKNFQERYLNKIEQIRLSAINLEQIVWALNSNKEHIKYIVKVFAVPDQYQRSEFSSDPNSVVSLKDSIIQTIFECQEVITICRKLREQIQNAVINSYFIHFTNSSFMDNH